MYNFKQQVAADVRRILSIDFAQDITFQPPLGAPVTISGYAGNHAYDVDLKGYVIGSSKKAHVTITEAALLAEGYITRNSAGDILTFAGHLVTFTDQSGLTKTYIIQKGESRANESIGTLTFTLGYVNTGDVPGRVIYGWSTYKVMANIVATLPDPVPMQALGNGDMIPLVYVLNPDRTLTIPYLALYPGIEVLTPFMLNNRPVQGMPYADGTFNNGAKGGFNVGNQTEFNATLPIFTIPT